MTTARELLESLTGFEEIAIEHATGKSLEAWSAGGRDLVVTRALVAVSRARETYDGKEKPATPALINSTVHAEYQKVQAMTQAEVSQFYEDEPEDMFPEDPDSEPGKDESPTVTEQIPSPTSV